MACGAFSPTTVENTLKNIGRKIKYKRLRPSMHQCVWLQRDFFFRFEPLNSSDDFLLRGMGKKKAEEESSLDRRMKGTLVPGKPVLAASSYSQNIVRAPTPFARPPFLFFSNLCMAVMSCLCFPFPVRRLFTCCMFLSQHKRSEKGQPPTPNPPNRDGLPVMWRWPPGSSVVYGQSTRPARKGQSQKSCWWH